MSAPIPYTKPSITALEVEYVTDAARNGWGEKCYRYISRFESAFSTHLDVRHVIPTSSCTGALHMGLAALGIGSGDEVVLADSNWIATASPIVHLGAKPVFVDILPDTWCIDPKRVIEVISPRTKAIIATHLYGNLCEMDELVDIGSKHGIPIIEDAAEAIGSIYDGRRAGSIGTFGTFSFHGTKTLTTGEGGALVTNDSQIYERLLTLSNHGRAKGEVKQFWPEAVGFKYKMSNVQAAIGVAQLERIEELINRKREILRDYENALGDIRGLHMNPRIEGRTLGAWMPTVVFSEDSGITREQLLTAFAAESIDARSFFWPLSSLPMFSPAETPVAHSIPGRSLNLPSFHDITFEQINRVTNVIRSLAAW